MSHQVYLWLGFGAFVLTMMVLDLGVFHRKAHVTSLREAAIWTAVWVGVALAFNAVIWWDRGTVSAVEFLTGYIIEWSLSMDNVFVFAVIFSYFVVPPQYQHRVLFWGILGAVVMRLVFIVAGAALVTIVALTLVIKVIWDLPQRVLGEFPQQGLNELREFYWGVAALGYVIVLKKRLLPLAGGPFVLKTRTAQTAVVGAGAPNVFLYSGTGPETFQAGTAGE